MTDFVCYEVIVDDNKPMIMIGCDEKDIVTATFEWSERIKFMRFISDDVFITHDANEKAMGVKWDNDKGQYVESL